MNYYRYGDVRGSGSGTGGILISLLTIVFAIFYTSIVGLLVPESKATKVADDMGMQNVTVVDRATFLVELRGCGKSDTVRLTVHGTRDGKDHEFYVCASLFKGGTYRSK